MQSALIINGVPIECINQAAVVYHVPAALIISVLGTEGGKVGMAMLNSNGTYDYGPMQINSIWLSRLKPYGITKQQLQYDPCINVAVGTWILSTRIADSKELWQGVASYHSYWLPENLRYRTKVSGIYQLLTRYLQQPSPQKSTISAIS